LILWRQLKAPKKVFHLIELMFVLLAKAIGQNQEPRLLNVPDVEVLVFKVKNRDLL
jgi:hypothetical protein